MAGRQFFVQRHLVDQKTTRHFHPGQALPRPGGQRTPGQPAGPGFTRCIGQAQAHQFGQPAAQQGPGRPGLGGLSVVQTIPGAGAGRTPLPARLQSEVIGCSQRLGQ